MSLLFIAAMGACGTGGGCGGCTSTGALPNGRLPTDQTVEGGAQIRITPAGFDKLKSVLPGVINQGLGNGFCAIPAGDVGVSILGFDLVSARYCQNNTAACGNPAGTGKGCTLTASLNQNGITTQVVGNSLRVGVSTSISTTIHIDFILAGFEVDQCDLNISSSNLGGSFDIDFGIQGANGELQVGLGGINEFNFGLNWSGCGILSDIGGFVTDFIDFIPDAFLDFLSPVFDPLIQSLLPNPLGIAGMVDIGDLLAGVSPGTDGFMEARVVPGGYVNLANQGMSLGVITGLNADEDPATRTAALDSEPHLCVPPLLAPSFGTAPHNLPTIARSGLGGSTFSLQAAGLFAGGADPAGVDLTMGISETTLDLAGHHMVTSGGMCLGVGTSFINQLNVGTIGILVPSLGELASDEGNDPLLLVTRPQRAIDFTIGENTAASPALTIHLQHLEVDFYAFLYERYTRAFTLDLTMNVGINLEFEQTVDGTVIKPSLVGISSSEVEVTVLNSQFVRESASDLEAVLPSVFDLVTPLLGTLPDIPVPSFAGFDLSPLSIQKVVTSQDDFLALTAQIGSSVMMRQMATRDLSAAKAVALLEGQLPKAEAASTGTARLLSVNTPEAATIRNALIKNTTGLPAITFDVDSHDAQGRELEWSWNINGGFWRPYSSASPLVVSDKAFAWQGKYEIGLKSRVKGNFRTVSAVSYEKVTIDSVGPQIFAEKAKWEDSQLVVPAWDVVGGRDFEVAFGEVGEDGPGTNWVPYRGASLARETAATLGQDHGGELVMYARDELGNQTIALIAPFHGQAGSSGCSCETTGRPGVGSLILFGLVGAGLMRRRRRNVIATLARFAANRTVRSVAMLAVVIGLSSLVPACSCGKNEAQSCETAADCGPDFCDEGQLPFCIDNTCVCSDDIPAGRIGIYSDVAVGGGQIWVSAYASTRGDLVVANATGGRIPNEAWEWVDGVPDGPVVVPDSKIRNGIDDAGADVGMYTSIAVANDGTPMVSYFDRDTASLKFAAKVGGVWQIHTVQQGTSQIDAGTGGSLIGMYTSLTLRTDDGRPGIAYLAHVADSTGEHAEVRYAAAQTQFPTSSADWQTWKVDTAPIPENPDEVYPLPGGLGLFVDSARNPMNQAPVVAYYDRTNGELKLSRFNPASGQFATPVVLDGSGEIDAGWSPAVQVDAQGVAHVVYTSATGDDLKYTTDAANAPKEIVDDGYRIVGTTVDGLPKPEFHFVGDDANLIIVPGGSPTVVYQDATTQELLVSQKSADGKWVRSSIAGATDPWTGAYGFFASGALGNTDIIMSSWVINQPESDNWVEVFSKPFVIQ